MLGTCRPGRVDEGIVQVLLNVVHNPPLEFRRIIGEHSNAVDRFFHRRFVARADRVLKILLQESHYPVRACL